MTRVSPCVSTPRWRTIAPSKEPLIVVVMSLPPAWLVHAPQGAPLVLTSKHPCWVPVLSSLAFALTPLFRVRDHGDRSA
jgi:hypothetical protein